MTDSCRVVVRLYDEAKKIYFNDITPFDVSVEFNRLGIDTADLTIPYSSRIRKLHRIEIWEDDSKLIFSGLVYDRKNDPQKRTTTIEANGDKWFFKKLYCTTPYNPSLPYGQIVDYLLNQQNILMNQRSGEYQGENILTLDISEFTELYGIFDDIAKQVEVDRTVSNGVVKFGSLGINTGIKLYYVAGGSNNDIDLTVKEGERASYLILEGKDIRTTITDYSQGNFGMIKRSCNISTMPELEAEAQRQLTQLQGKNLIYEIKDIKGGLDLNVYDKLNIVIDEKGEITNLTDITVQKKNMVYKGFIKTVQYSLSNGDITYNNRYGFFIR